MKQDREVLKYVLYVATIEHKLGTQFLRFFDPSLPSVTPLCPNAKANPSLPQVCYVIYEQPLSLVESKQQIQKRCPVSVI